MCYNSCTHFVAHTGGCRLPRGHPCPMDYADDADLQAAEAEADFFRERSLFFTHQNLAKEQLHATNNHPGIVPA